MFLSKLGSASLFGLLSMGPFKVVIGKPLLEVKAVMDPLTAITIAKTSLDVISSFTGGKDSSMSAMFRYQASMLKQIILQINQVQDKLLEIQNAIHNLPDEFKKILEEQFRVELMTDIRAATYRYSKYVLEPSLINPSIIQSDTAKSEISNIMFLADQRITSLKLIEGSLGPNVCMILPLAISLSIACRTSLNYSKAVILSTLNDYREWLEDILSDKTGAIKDFIVQAAQRHDALLSELDNDRLANRLALKNFKLNGSQMGDEATDPAVIFSHYGPTRIQDLPIDSYAGTRGADKLISVSRAMYRRDSRIVLYNDTKLDGFLMEYKSSPPLIFSGDEKVNSLSAKPKSGDYYYIEETVWKKAYPATVIHELIDKGHTAANVDDVSRAKIKLKIAEANLERAKMIFAAQANIVALNTKNRIQEYINLLKL